MSNVNENNESMNSVDETQNIRAEDHGSDLSDYAKKRALNIERNNAKLRELGLLSRIEEKESNDAAWERNTAASVNIRERKRKLVKEKKEPTRFSKRIRGEQANGEKVIEKTKEMIKKEREERVIECREVRLRVANEVAKIDPNGKKAAMANRTATYEHCAMRVRTMSERALNKRIKTIERAAGKHCIIKMAIFKCCLQDKGYWELAELANSSLERLKALMPPSSSTDI